MRAPLRNTTLAKTLRKGFTLTELVIVILVIGILAAIAAPRFTDSCGAAKHNGLKESLRVVRNAIELYKLTNDGAYPPCIEAGDNFRTALKPFIQGQFPSCPVGPAQNNEIACVTTPATQGSGNPIQGWKFNTTTGKFICNYNKVTECDSSLNYDDL